MTWLIATAAFVCAVAIGVPLAIFVTRPIRRDKKLAQRFALASALFFAFAFINRREAQLTQEADEETTRKKDQPSGEPPLV